MKIISIILFLTLLISCKITDETIEIEQVDTDLPVILRMRSTTKKIWAIQFPIKIKVINNSLKKRCFTSFKYLYNNNLRGGKIPMYIEENGELKRKSSNEIKCLKLYKPKEYIIYSRHYVDSSKLVQISLKPYKDKMLTLNQDTLIINSKNFKEKHFKLMKNLLEKDTIRLHFNHFKSKSQNWVKAPVQW